MNDNDGTRLACPHCGNANLWSDEPCTVMYTVKLTRVGGGSVAVEYDGLGYEVVDEAATYVGSIWCRACGSELDEAQLVGTGESDDSPGFIR